MGEGKYTKRKGSFPSIIGETIPIPEKLKWGWDAIKDRWKAIFQTPPNPGGLGGYKRTKEEASGERMYFDCF